ncbi:MAG: DUF362 domain-containing protein [Candidatus Omnitrophica bacterium]|nr:DUF362 domain-containing protein [Candidatus Omnitrophota bacterium]
MKRVVILKIDNYDKVVLKKKIKEALVKYFSLNTLFNATDKILLKPNLLMAAKPEDAVVTHPALVEAVADIFKEQTKNIFLADSPGGFLEQKDIDYIYEETGMLDVARRLNIELLYPDKSFMREGFPLCWWASGFAMVNLAKLKTHEVTLLTLAVKNLYGCISGLHKSHLHKAYPQTQDFSQVITKLYSLVKPRLNIVDGILALEGDGPAKAGRPKKLGLVVIGDDALYTDYAIGRLLGLKDEEHPIIAQAIKEGQFSPKDLEIISEVEPITGFKLPSPFILNKIPKRLTLFVKLFFNFKIAINKRKCKMCLACKNICPQQAIEIHEGSLAVDQSCCVMCNCCGEACRFGAVDLEKSFLLKLLSGLSSLLKRA